MTRYARRERAALADLLADLGPDAPTLCEGWRTRDLAAHLVLRERRPHQALGVVLPPLAGLTERAQRRLAGTAYDDLVAAVRSGPPRWNPLALPALDEASGLVEFAVHHEDVRRAQPGWRPRELEPAEQERLWARLRGVVRLQGRRLPVAVQLRAPGREPIGVGDGPAATVEGEPLELLLWTLGRGSHARVGLGGDSRAQEQLQAARLAI